MYSVDKLAGDKGGSHLRDRLANLDNERPVTPKSSEPAPSEPHDAPLDDFDDMFHEPPEPAFGADDLGGERPGGGPVADDGQPQIHPNWGMDPAELLSREEKPGMLKSIGKAMWNNPKTTVGGGVGAGLGYEYEKEKNSNWKGAKEADRLAHPDDDFWSYQNQVKDFGVKPVMTPKTPTKESLQNKLFKEFKTFIEKK